jgi:mannose-6-phosphate isomerase class I
VIRVYEPNPTYAAVGGSVEVGWEAACVRLSAGGQMLAVDGPAILDWEAALGGLSAALSDRSIRHRVVRTDAYFAEWERILERTSTPELAEDPDFARLAQVRLREFFGELPNLRPSESELLVIAGPGAALFDHDVLWYADLPKRYAEAAVRRGEGRNLGQPRDRGAATTRRLFYIDWTLLDRHREEVAERIDLWIDTQDPGRPTHLDGAALRRTVSDLAHRPVRTRPTFNTAPWGGHWGQQELGFAREEANTAIGYELIAPESGVLVGEPNGPRAEVPFQLMVALQPTEILGKRVEADFGTSFPIRFDYLDTVGGGNLSIHCHPQADYMERVFGWPYTQHESYYMMVGGEDRCVFLGLRGDVQLDAFERAARGAVERGERFRIEDHVQTFPAAQHRLFMIPAGTPHGSGEGNVVLEVSATPYLYSLRFYDWLRRDAAGNQRPVHVDHAFANLNRERKGDEVATDLVQSPHVIRSGDGWREEVIGALPEVFYEVRRLVIEGETAADDDTDGRFHVLNVVDGDGAVIEGEEAGRHRLNYAETIVIPAAIGRYSLRRMGGEPVQIVKALVR